MSEVKEKSSIIKDAIILLLITLIAGVALGFVYEITKAPIAEANEKAKQEAYQTVYPDAAEFAADDAITKAVEDTADTFDGATVDEVLAAKDSSGEVIGYVMSLTGKEGYGGEITLSMGIDVEGTITGMEVLTANETAGLGAKCQEPEFKDQFKGKTGTELEVVKTGDANESQVDAISGATITSKAVTKAVNAGLKFVSENVK